MTDWGDAILNEKARPRSMPLPPDPHLAQPAMAVAKALQAIGASLVSEGERMVPRPELPDIPTDRRDTGQRIRPTEGGS